MLTAVAASDVSSSPCNLSRGTPLIWTTDGHPARSNVNTNPRDWNQQKAQTGMSFWCHINTGDRDGRACARDYNVTDSKSRADVVLDSPLAGPLRPICRHSFPPICQSGRWEQGEQEWTGWEWVARRNKAKWDSGGFGDHRVSRCVPLSSKAWSYEAVFFFFFLLFFLSWLRFTKQNNLFTLSLPHADRGGISIQVLAAVPLRPAG